MNTYLVQIRVGNNTTHAIIHCASDQLMDRVFSLAGNKQEASIQWQLLGEGTPRLRCTPRLSLFTEEQLDAYQRGYVGAPYRTGTFLQRAMSAIGLIDSEADEANGREGDSND
jgi:hypothetical protein